MRRYCKRKRDEQKAQKCIVCTGWWREAVAQRRIKKAVDYALRQGHGVKGCDMYHPGCVACRMVDLLVDD